MQYRRAKTLIDNWPILWAAWAFQLIPVNQNSIDQMGRFLLNN